MCVMQVIGGSILEGITTLSPFMTSPSRIVNSSRRHKYWSRSSGKSCVLSGQPVMMRSVSAAKVMSAFISSCKDLSRVGSAFRTSAMSMSRPGIALTAFQFNGTRECVNDQHALGSNKLHFIVIFRARGNNILCRRTDSWWGRHCQLQFLSNNNSSNFWS